MGWVLHATGTPGGMVADSAEVRRALALFADPAGGCELMALRSGAHRTLPGSDLDGLCRAADELPGGSGVYFRVNPVPVGREKPANNGDVTSRRWVYVDVDPRRAEGHADDPATAHEKDLAGTVADDVVEYLRGKGWPVPVITDSGNGYGLFWRCDLPNDAIVRALLQRLLKDLSERFTCERGVVDKSVHNANRLAKLPGTWARKGTASEDRPYRVCRLLVAPEDLEGVTAELLAETVGQEHHPGPRAGVNGTHTYTADVHYNAPPAGRADAYGRRALDAECVRVMLAQPGERNNALNRAAFVLGQLVAGGVLAEATVRDRLFTAACSCGLDRDPGCGAAGIRSTIDSGLGKGKGEPRGVPEGRGPDGRPFFGAGQPGVNGTAAPPTGPVIYWASSVTPRAVEWLWPGRIPLGKLTTFAGNGGLGKTFVLCDVIARITTGREWPEAGGECREPSRCLFISGEDDPEDTLVPRLIESGADLNRVAFLKTERLDRFTLADLTTLNAALEQMGADTRLVAIDPPTAYLGGVDDHKNAELRGLLSPLALWAHKHRLSIVFNTHVNKPQGAKVEAMMRVMGSVAWVNAMRSAYMFARDPSDGERRLFVGMKNNLGKERKGLAYRIASTDALARVEWLGEVDTTADEAVGGGDRRVRRDVAASTWLVERFRERLEWDSDDLFRAARQGNVSRNAVFEAKKLLALPTARKVMQENGDTKYVWWVPADWPPLSRPECVPTGTPGTPGTPG